MCIKKVKRKCYIKGCKNTECFAISRTRELGNTIIVCKDCLEEALSSISKMSPEENANVPVIENSAVPSLFFNAEAMGRSEIKDDLTAETAIIDENPTIPEQTEPEEQLEEDEHSEDVVSDVIDEVFVCPECGKEFSSARALTTHLRYCKPEK